MFSLELNTTQNGTGKLVIGAVDTLLEHPDTIKLPVIDDPKGKFTRMWTTPIKSLSVDPAIPPHEIPFPGDYMAVLDPGIFQTILPRGIGVEILKLLGAYRYQWINAIDCSLVRTLPDLLFTFGGNQTVSMTSKEYVLKIAVLEGVPAVCTIAIDDVGEYPDIPDNIVVLGSSFLRGFHSIWDWGNRTISCK
jgi:hypothetical protein